jgi:hypothetical protein
VMSASSSSMSAPGRFGLAVTVALSTSGFENVARTVAGTSIGSAGVTSHVPVRDGPVHPARTVANRTRGTTLFIAGLLRLETKQG